MNNTNICNMQTIKDTLLAKKNKAFNALKKAENQTDTAELLYMSSWNSETESNVRDARKLEQNAQENFQHASNMYINAYNADKLGGIYAEYFECLVNFNRIYHQNKTTCV